MSKNTDEIWRLDASTVGLLVHRLIATELTAGRRSPSGPELVDAVSGLPEVRETAHLERRALRMRVLTSAGAYFRFFVPGNEWLFLGGDFSAGGASFDLAFAHRTTGRVFADEIKTGEVASVKRYERQLAQEVAAGIEKWGVDGFLGVRLLLLLTPQECVFAGADGLFRALAEVTLP